METIELKSQSVAEFMGAKYSKSAGFMFDLFASPYSNCGHNLKFHTSWEWLMPVVKKCKSISLQSEELAFDNGKPTTNLHIQNLYEEIEDGLLELDIDLTFEAVVNFIEYFKEIN